MDGLLMFIAGALVGAGVVCLLWVRWSERFIERVSIMLATDDEGQKAAKTIFENVLESERRKHER